MAAGVSQDWYQDARFVTITLRLPPEINNSTVTPRFKGNYCAVLQDGVTIWSCSLCHSVSPQSCQLKKAGKNRIELKLMKATPDHWRELKGPDNDIESDDDDDYHTPPVYLSPSHTPLPPPPPPPIVPHQSHHMTSNTDHMTSVSDHMTTAPLDEATTMERDNELNNLNNLNNLNDADDHKPVGKTVINFEFNPFMLQRVEQITPTNTETGINETGINATEINETGINDTEFKETGINETGISETGINENGINETGINETGISETGINEISRDQSLVISEAEPVEKISLFYRLPPDSFVSPSLTGISNTGNTCFMSSILQCLSNTPELRDYFLGGLYKKDLNTTNPLGFQGELADCFNIMIDKLWSGKMEYISARKIKELIGSKREEFSGYAQQDAHEFTTFFLDGLHEDLNRIKDKPYIAQIESDGRPDDIVSEESWINYKKRNDSIIADLFGGQFKSSLICPECSKESVTFDPFMSLSVPLPHQSATISVLFFNKDPTIRPRQVLVTLPSESTLEILKLSVATKVNVSVKYLRVFEVRGGRRVYNMKANNKRLLSSIKDDDVIVMCEVLSYLEAKEQVIELSMIQRLKYPSLPLKCNYCRKRGEDFKRCGRCKSVQYCSKDCQKADWSFHSKKCSSLLSNLSSVGLPFVISLPITQMTYDNIYQQAHLYAKWSVQYEILSENGSSHFELVPVDDHCLSNNSPLIDKGKDTLTLSNNFISIDWKNNPSSLRVTNKDLSSYLTSGSSDRSHDIHLNDCLQLFIEPEKLPSDNAWYCPCCKEHREATKCLSVSRLPHILIIHLKRFSFNDVSRRGKIDKYVKFPLRGLDMSPYVKGTTSSSSVYDLYATVNHYGAVFMGHYIANIKSPTGDSREWLRYDDESVAYIKKQLISDNSAYLLLYRRREF